MIRTGFAFPERNDDNAPGHAPDGESRLNPMTGQHDRVPGFSKAQPPMQSTGFHTRGGALDTEEFGTTCGGEDRLVTRAPGADDGANFGKAI